MLVTSEYQQLCMYPTEKILFHGSGYTDVVGSYGLRILLVQGRDVY